MVIKSVLGAICTCLVVVSFNANAIPVLESRLEGLAYYDPVADLTWLANANAAGTAMNWADANSWATALNVAGVTGWRLPDTLQPDASCEYQQSGGVSFGFNCTGSEMGNLFYNVLGGVAGQPITTIHNANYDLFSNVQPYYWSATEFAPNPSLHAWGFFMREGSQLVNDKLPDYLFAWAVQSDDVSAVPEPPMMLLITTGLFGLVWKARMKLV